MAIPSAHRWQKRMLARFPRLAIADPEGTIAIGTYLVHIGFEGRHKQQRKRARLAYGLLPD
jgi:hypothetical protein